MNARDTRCDGKVQCPNPMDHVNRAEILFGSWEQNLYGDTHNAQQNKKDRTRQPSTYTSADSSLGSWDSFAHVPVLTSIHSDTP